MKKFLLVLSLVANAALLAAYLGSPSPTPAPTAASSPIPPTSALASTLNSPTTATFADLARGDLAATAARLRADGVSPRLIRAIIGALVAQKFADRHKALVAAMAAKPWWQGQSFEPYTDPKVTALRRQLARDEREAVAAILGPEVPENDYDRAWAERKYGPMSPVTKARFREINADYDDLMAEVRAQAHDIILPEDRAKLAYLEAEKRADIAKLLTPDELFEFTLRSSPTANRIRNQLASFDPTEAEYRAIFKIQQAVDAQFGGGKNQNLTQDERRQLRDQLNATTEQVRAVLTPERFAEYQLASDPAYPRTRDFVASLQLPTPIAAQLIAVQNDTTARQQAIVADTTLTGSQRTAQFAALAEQANTALAGKLGQAGLESYKQSAGTWLTNLERRAQPRATAPK